MTFPVPSDVPSAALFLDEQMPGWHTRINLDILCMSSMSKCILGQLSDDGCDLSLGMEWFGHDYMPSVHSPFGWSYRVEHDWKHEIARRTNYIVRLDYDIL